MMHIIRRSRMERILFWILNFLYVKRYRPLITRHSRVGPNSVWLKKTVLRVPCAILTPCKRFGPDGKRIVWSGHSIILCVGPSPLNCASRKLGRERVGRLGRASRIIGCEKTVMAMTARKTTNNDSSTPDYTSGLQTVFRDNSCIHIYRI